MFKSINPYDQSVIGEYPEHNPVEISKKLKNASHAFSVWRKESFESRANVMHNAAKLLRENKERYALSITVEMGKVIAE
jgi:succinate-semialdehyde dehydrogenase / glutarate-semialdehyde dehydrogenase